MQFARVHLSLDKPAPASAADQRYQRDTGGYCRPSYFFMADLQLKDDGSGERASSYYDRMAHVKMGGRAAHQGLGTKCRAERTSSSASSTRKFLGPIPLVFHFDMFFGNDWSFAWMNSDGWQ